MIWYHGTSKECWKQIQTEGVLFGVRGLGANRCTYLAADIQEAKCYGEIVLQVDYDPFINSKDNNYVDGCWQMRVYEPIPLNKIKVIVTPSDLVVEHNVHEKEVNEMLAQIDGEALSELSEKPMNQEGLEGEIEMEWDSFSKHLAEYDDDDSDEVIWLNKFSFTDIARHFAQWGAEHAREQMLKEAVEIEVWNYSSCTDLRAIPLWGIDKFNNLEDGDKVRVIVLPKED